MEKQNKEIKKEKKKIIIFKILIGIQIIITSGLIFIVLWGLLGLFTDTHCESSKQNNNTSSIWHLTDEEIIQLNKPFEVYGGVQKGTNVKFLIQIVNSYNAQYAGDEDFQIRINNRYDKTATDEEVLKGEPSGNTELSEKKCDHYDINNIKSAKMYRVNLNYEKGDTNNTICNIDIQEYNKTEQ